MHPARLFAPARLLTLACLAGFGCASAGPDEPMFLDPEPDDPPVDVAPDPPDPPDDPARPPDDPAPDPAPAPTPERDWPACDPADYEAVSAQLERDLRDNRVPGGALAIVCQGRLAFARGFGVTRAGGAGVSEDTRFQWASTTKMFTGALAARLASAGVVDLHAPVSRWLGPATWGEITLHQLLSHTAGFPTDFARFDPDLARVVSSNADMPLWAPPGAVWNYSNPGFSVAGAALEAAAGRPFATLVQDEIFTPARMLATMDVTRVMAGDYAPGHSGSADAPSVVAADGAYFHTSYYSPMGGAWGSVVDLARWAEAHLAGDPAVLDAAGWTALRTPHSRTGSWGRSYGYGLGVDDSVAPVVLSHSGSAPGYLADWTLVPEAGVGVFILVNADWFFPGEAAWLARERLAPGRDVGPSPADPRTTWAGLEGTYTDPHTLGDVRVFVEGAALKAEFAAAGVTRTLEHVWEDAYTAPHPVSDPWPLDLVFWRDSPGGRGAFVVSIWGVAARR